MMSSIKLYKNILLKRNQSSQMKRLLSTTSRLCMFLGEKDRFNGITVDLSKEQFDQSLFTTKLDESIQKWKEEGRRCIWFKIDIGLSICVPMLAEKGFNFHHARDTFVMMYKWLPEDSKPNLPPTPHTNLGVGAMVFNSKNQILAVSEKNYEYPHWKLPGGYVEKGEHLSVAAKREVKEETGIDAEFQSLVTFRHTHNMMFGNTDIYVLMTMKALTEQIVKSQREVNDCKWMEVDEYVNHPHVNKWNRMVINKALEYKNRNLKLNLINALVKYGPYTRDISYLDLEDVS